MVCEQNMGDVKLFNDAGKMPNATKPLKMLKEAIVIMTAAERDSAQAASEIKKVRGGVAQGMHDFGREAHFFAGKLQGRIVLGGLRALAG
jgi:hypothetical protein